MRSAETVSAFTSSESLREEAGRWGRSEEAGRWGRSGEAGRRGGGEAVAAGAAGDARRRGGEAAPEARRLSRSQRGGGLARERQAGNFEGREQSHRLYVPVGVRHASFDASPLASSYALRLLGRDRRLGRSSARYISGRGGGRSSPLRGHA